MSHQTAYRTHHVNEVTEDVVGQTVTISGWVDRRRDHGGVAFLDVRDASGLVQVVVYDEEVARPLRSEYVVQVTGDVRLRPEGNENSHLATGKVEIVASKIDVLAKSAALPFQVSTALANETEQQLPGEEMPQTASAAPEKGQAAESAEPGTSATAAPGLLSFSQTLDATSGATSTAPQAMPQTDYEIPKQIVDQARLIQRGQDTEMVIHLKPDHLGDLTLRVSVGTDGAVNASFHSSNAEVRTIIENSLVQLKQELNNQGIKVDNVGVYAGLADGGLPQDQGQQQAFQQGSQQHRSTRESAAAFEDGQELAAALAAQEGNTATDGVDYRI